MFILFQTDKTFSREGFQISYILEGAPTTTARVNTNKLIPERTLMTTARIITSKPTINLFHYFTVHLYNIPDSNRKLKLSFYVMQRY